MSVQYDVTVITTFYNARAYVKECIDCVCQQTKDRVQLILIDDGSTDDGLTLARSAAENNQAITLVHKTNSGLGDSRNVAMTYAQGKYIYFLDVDDYIDPNALEWLYAQAVQTQVDVVYFNSLAVHEDTQFLQILDGSFNIPADNDSEAAYAERSPESLGIMTGREYMLRSLERGEFFIPVWLGFYRREFLQRCAPAFEPIIHEDNIWSMEVALHANAVLVTNKVLHYRRVVSSSIMHQKKTARHVTGALRVLEHAVEVASTESCDKRSARAFHQWTMLSAGMVYYALVSSDKSVRKRYKPEFVSILYKHPRMFNARIMLSALVRI